MEKGGGAKGAAGSKQTPEGCLPAAWHQGPLPVGHPRSEGSATHTCSGDQVWRASPQRRFSSPKPGVRQPRAGCGPHTIPFSKERRLKPTPRPFLLAQTPRGLTAGRGRTRVGRGRAPRVSHTHRQRMLAGPALSAPPLAVCPPWLAPRLPPARSPPTGAPSSGPSSTLMLPGNIPASSPRLPKPQPPRT